MEAKPLKAEKNMGGEHYFDQSITENRYKPGRRNMVRRQSPSPFVYSRSILGKQSFRGERHAAAGRSLCVRERPNDTRIYRT